MTLASIRVGFALTGSHCTLAEVVPQVEKLVDLGADVYPILSPAVSRSDTRFGTASHWCSTLQQVTGREPWKTIVEVEPIGPRGLLDIVVIAPCTGNTMSKLAHGISDTPVTLAAKAHLRNGGPVVLGITSNDGLGLNARSLGSLLVSRSVFFVPFGQDNALEKPNSLSAHWNLTTDTIEHALKFRQVQPLLRAFD